MSRKFPITIKKRLELLCRHQIQRKFGPHLKQPGCNFLHRLLFFNQSASNPLQSAAPLLQKAAQPFKDIAHPCKVGGPDVKGIARSVKDRPQPLTKIAAPLKDRGPPVKEVAAFLTGMTILVQARPGHVT